jgi:formylglycine-generating enzyme required for sulfatase activity/serine/threonine protein kinase
MALPDTLGLVGTTIAEKYLLEGVVGEGGFAVVYRATHQLWKRPVAVKVFKALGDVPADQRDKLLEEFIREGALLAELSERSAAIVQARDVGMLKTPRGEQVPYMVLEWLEGKSLESAIQDEKAKDLPYRTIEEAVTLLDPAAEALALAHVKGIAHRDVKPANVFVLGDPRGACTVKLLDFGIAKVVQDAQKMAGSFAKTSGQVTSFTPAYGAPEQFTRTHGATGPWTDVFALALVAVEVLTQRDPLDGDDFMQLAFASANPAVRPTPRARGVHVSDEVEAVFAKALAVKPQDRYDTAGEFWNALRAAVHMKPLRVITGRNPGSSPRPDEVGTAPTVNIDAITGPRAPTAPMAPAASTQGMTGGPMEPAASPAKKGAPMGLLVGGGVAAVVVIGAVVALAGGGKKADGAPGASSAAPGAGASPSADPSAGGACPEGMIRIPGGEFFMGSDDDLPLEKPAHHVKLSPYCIDELEVTLAKYKDCSDRGACKRAGSVNEGGGIPEHDKKAYDALCNARDAADKAKHPVNCVDWNQAEQFCELQAPGGRLPTEAEWEFAARGPDGRKYPWGDEIPSAAHLNACGLECLAWGKANHVDGLAAMYQADDGYPNTAPVGSFPQGKSRYGVQDVVGNVWEWVGDRFAPYPREDEGRKAPMAMDPKGPSAGAERVIRGGAWNGRDPGWVRPTFRFHDAPEKRNYAIGFRCARPL